MMKPPESAGGLAVATALTANLILALAKGLAFSWTGSASMLSESLHSVADCFNQVMLAVGIQVSRRTADAQHPYGYGRSRWAWAVVSAMGVLFIGAGVAVFNGVEHILHPQPLQGLGWAGAILGLAAVLEGGSFLVALRSVSQAARADGMGPMAYLRRGGQPAAVAVVVEDGTALIGVAIAGSALLLAHLTANPIYDALGSVMIGILLAMSAAFLVYRNLDLLAGRAVPPHTRDAIVTVLLADPVVVGLHDVKVLLIGPGKMRFKAEIELDGREIATRALPSFDEPQDPDDVLPAFGEVLVHEVGRQIDRLEASVRKQVPGVAHIDLEVHLPHRMETP
jgi:zinc transporter 9